MTLLAVLEVALLAALGATIVAGFYGRFLFAFGTAAVGFAIGVQLLSMGVPS